jgi:cytochrome c biogenesis protein CcdA/thiol-disulfide isomerase/thioredoxin
VTDLGLAFGAGVLTIAAPCVLPMLPIILGGSVGLRPLSIVGGFVATFTALGLVLSRLTDAAGIAPGVLREAALVLLTGLGALMIWPAPFERLAARLAGLVRRADGVAARAGNGNVGGLVLGAVIGVLWTPCAGPVLATTLTLVATAPNPARGATLLAGYALGAGLPMLAIAYGGQRVVARVRRYTPWAASLQRAFGVLIVATALAIHGGWDVQLAGGLVPAFDGGDEAPVGVADGGPAPELAGVTAWLNSGPLTLAALRGRVVLLDFWTYSCVNCVRALPHVVDWYERYRDAGLVVIGVHTPEFPYERATDGVRAAVARLGITYPVAQDNAYTTWKAYDNHFWPAQYLVDRRGRVVLKHFGEGQYEAVENAIRTVLETSPPERPTLP